MKPLAAKSLKSAGCVIVMLLALAVVFLANLQAQKAGETPKRMVTREDLTGAKWDFRSTALPGKVFTGVWTFNSDKTMSKGTGPMAAWSIRGKTLRVEHANDNWQVFSLESESPKESPLVIKEVDSSAGKRDGITLTQQVEK
jgi:hypothetical protein